MQLRLWLHRPSAGGPGLQFAVHLAGKLRIILRLAGVYIQEFLLVAQLTQPSARSRTSAVGLSDTRSRKQVASYPLQVPRVSHFVNLRIKVIGGVKRHRGTAALPSCNTGLDVE
jgi:hypothetical protein